MSETQQPGPDEQAEKPQTPEPEQAEAPADEGSGTDGTDEPQVGRRPEFVEEQADADADAEE